MRLVTPVTGAFACAGERWEVQDTAKASADCLIQVSVNGHNLGRFWIADHVLRTSQPSAVALFTFHAIQYLTEKCALTAGQHRPTCLVHGHAQVVSEVYGGLLLHCPDGASDARAIRIPAATSRQPLGEELWVGGVADRGAATRIVAIVHGGGDARLTHVSGWPQLHDLADRSPGHVRLRWPVGGHAWAVEHWGADPRTCAKDASEPIVANN